MKGTSYQHDRAGFIMYNLQFLKGYVVKHGLVCVYLTMYTIKCPTLGFGMIYVFSLHMQ